LSILMKQKPVGVLAPSDAETEPELTLCGV